MFTEFFFNATLVGIVFLTFIIPQRMTSTVILACVFTTVFRFRIGGAPDVCVDALLEASVKYSPHFDWVVAHIGFVFFTYFAPTQIIFFNLTTYMDAGC